jgi:hypothetical protein
VINTDTKKCTSILRTVKFDIASIVASKAFVQIGSDSKATVLHHYSLSLLFHCNGKIFQRSLLDNFSHHHNSKIFTLLYVTATIPRTN